MILKNITQGVNELLAGELLSYGQMRRHLDAVITDINTQLSAVFPLFSELPVTATEYNAIPDRYIHSVVLVGAAYYFYMTDEEGSPTAVAYETTYRANLFYMVRDYLMNVPESYRAALDNGVLPFQVSGTVERTVSAVKVGSTPPHTGTTTPEYSPDLLAEVKTATAALVSSANSATAELMSSANSALQTHHDTFNGMVGDMQTITDLYAAIIGGV